MLILTLFWEHFSKDNHKLGGGGHSKVEIKKGE